MVNNPDVWLLSGIYLSARDHYTHMRCTRGTPLNGKKSCGYDFHYDLAAGLTQAEGSVLTPDYTAEGAYATDVLTDHTVKLVKDHNASEVIIHCVDFFQLHNSLSHILTLKVRSHGLGFEMTEPCLGTPYTGRETNKFIILRVSTAQSVYSTYMKIPKFSVTE